MNMNQAWDSIATEAKAHVDALDGQDHRISVRVTWRIVLAECLGCDWIRSCMWNVD